MRVAAIFVPGYVTHLELAWKLPTFTPFLRKMAAYSRLIKFDKRGTGMSDPVSGAPTLETRMDDVRAVVGRRRVAPRRALRALRGAVDERALRGNVPGANGRAHPAQRLRVNKDIDIRNVLPAVRVPTLVLHGDRGRTRSARGCSSGISLQAPGSTSRIAASGS